MKDGRFQISPVALYAACPERRQFKIRLQGIGDLNILLVYDVS